jgi:hypothetical protein
MMASRSATLVRSLRRLWIAVVAVDFVSSDGFFGVLVCADFEDRDCSMVACSAPSSRMRSHTEGK